MIFRPAALPGVFVVELQIRRDERGGFARAYCDEEMAGAGLNTRWPQHNVSLNTKRGTVRGMHWQAAPHGEIKMIRCTRGSVHDVLVDLRRDSPTYLKSEAFALTQQNHVTLYVPEGIAHGYQTLEDDAELFYLMSAVYVPSAARGVRYDDPRVGVRWPLPVSTISERDVSFPDWVD